MAAMRGHGLAAPDRARQFRAAPSPSATASARARRSCAAAEPATAIVAANDRLAIGCYDALERRGLRCPEDVSIIGFNDMPFIDRLRPPLTSVRVPQREIGAVAADLLLRLLADTPPDVHEVLLAPSLIVRRSTAPPPA